MNNNWQPIETAPQNDAEILIQEGFMVNQEPVLMRWMDRDINDLTREELLVVVQRLARDVENQREANKRTLNMWDMCRKARILNLNDSVCAGHL